MCLSFFPLSGSTTGASVGAATVCIFFLVMSFFSLRIRFSFRFTATACESTCNFAFGCCKFVRSARWHCRRRTQRTLSPCRFRRPNTCSSRNQKPGGDPHRRGPPPRCSWLAAPAALTVGGYKAVGVDFGCTSYFSGLGGWLLCLSGCVHGLSCSFADCTVAVMLVVVFGDWLAGLVIAWSVLCGV
jgi:hypothetical protein